MFKKPFSTLNIIFYIAIFIFLVRNESYVIFILLYCLVTFCMPVAVAKKICSLNSKDLFDKAQNFANNWYTNHILKSEDIGQDDTKPEELINSKHNDLNPNPFDIPEPSDDFLADVKHEEVWGIYYDNNVENSDEK